MIAATQNGADTNHTHSNGASSTNGSNEQTKPQAEPQVAQIRELIFGEQMLGYEERFAKLEKKLSDDVAEMRASVEKSLSELRDLMQKRSDDIETAAVPRSQIADSLEQLARSLRG